MKPFLFFTIALVCLVASAAGFTVEVESFPPGQKLEPGTVVLLKVEGLKKGEEPVWHFRGVESDILENFDNETGRFRLFHGTESGQRTFVVQVPSDGQDEIEIVQFQYGEGIGPDPLPPPPPGDKYQIVIVYESNERENLPSGQQVILSSLTFREELKKAGHKLVEGGIVDQHIKDAGGKVHATLAPFFNACKGKKLPRLCLAPLKGGTIVTYPLPADEVGVFKILGGKNAKD